jgi:hypothetical protein
MRASGFPALLAASLLVTSTLCAFAPARQSPVSQGSELKQAQAVVAEFVSRLHRTLSFEAASDGVLIELPMARTEALDENDRGVFPQMDTGLEPALLGLSGLEPGYARRIDGDRLRRISFAQWDYLYLGLLGGVPDCGDSKGLEAQDICPLLHRLEPQKQGINGDAAADAMLETLQQLYAALRRRLPPEPFKSAAYKNGLQKAEKEWSAASHRLDRSDSEGRSPWGDVFFVSQEGFAFYVVQVDGRFRIWKIAVPWLD